MRCGAGTAHGWPLCSSPPCERCSSSSLEDSKYLGATPAFISALHTWGRSLSLHPHVHVLIADGGLSNDGAWAKPRRSHFLPARVVMLVFRGKLLATLRRALEHGELRVPADSSRERVRSMLNRLGRKKWNVHIRARYAHGEGVAAYLARYLKGGPLKNTQLTEVSAQRVEFRYRPHRDEDDAGEDCRLMTLTPEAFLARYLTHIPVPRLQAVRGYGLYGQRHGAALDQARALLGQAPVEEPKPVSAPQFLARFRNTTDTGRCSTCGALLVFTSLIRHGTGPPPSLH